MIFQENEFIRQQPILKVIGVGGGGGNAVERMIVDGVKGVDFVVVNTDSQDLGNSQASTRIQIGRKSFKKGYGAGGRPEIGRKAALESEDELKMVVRGADMIFITAGMGGGTGTGAAPVVARIAKEEGCLTVAFVTTPFVHEGKVRMENALSGIAELKKYVDALIVVPNQRLFNTSSRSTGLLKAFDEANKVLRQGVQGITETIRIPGLINIDFNDIRTVIENKGSALMGIGIASGENRAIAATRKAIHSKLLETSIEGATDAIVNIAGNEDIGLLEIEQVLAEIRNATIDGINIIHGTTINVDLKDEIIVTVVATGPNLKPRKTDDLYIREVISKASTTLDNNPNIIDEKQEEEKKENKIISGKLPSWLKRR